MILTLALLLFSATNVVESRSTRKPVSEKPRVVGGFSCSPDTYPYLVSIYIQNNIIWCGGSLLNRNVVLTSAHCCSKGKSDLSIEAGASVARTSEVQTSKVLKLTKHPNFTTDGTVKNDICLIQLETPIEANEVVRYLKPANSSYFEELMEEQKCNYSIVLGFGYQGAKYIDNTLVNVKTSYNKYLQCLHMTPITKQECDFFYPQALNMFCGKDSRSMIQGDTCQGDSGGPIVCENVQIGIVTEGWGCGIGVPAIYTRVDKYLDFIYPISLRSTQDVKCRNALLVLLCFIVQIKL